MKTTDQGMDGQDLEEARFIQFEDTDETFQAEYWGSVRFWVSVSQQGWEVRKLEVYGSGVILKYSPEHPVGEYGGLADHPYDEKMFDTLRQHTQNYREISAEEFEEAWSSHVAKWEK